MTTQLNLVYASGLLLATSMSKKLEVHVTKTKNEGQFKRVVSACIFNHFQFLLSFLNKYN